MPYYNIFKHLDFLTVDLGGITGQLGVDSVRKVFTSPQGTRFGVAICYESIYGEYFTEFIRNGAQLMFVITNDGWWGDTPGYRQHFSYARLRAIETRRSIARSANTGISGFINARGDVGETLGWDVRGALTSQVGLHDRMTLHPLRRRDRPHLVVRFCARAALFHGLPGTQTQPPERLKSAGQKQALRN